RSGPRPSGGASPSPSRGSAPSTRGRTAAWTSTRCAASCSSWTAARTSRAPRARSGSTTWGCTETVSRGTTVLWPHSCGVGSLDMGLRPDDFTVPHADIREEVGLLEPPAVSIQLPPIPFEGKSADGDVLGSLDSVDDEPPRGSRAGFEGEVSAVRPEGRPDDLVVRPAGDAISDHALTLSVECQVRQPLQVRTATRIPSL